MSRIRMSLLGLAVVLMALASRGQAVAVNNCAHLCISEVEACIATCNGNQTCVNNCNTKYSTCYADCERE